MLRLVAKQVFPSELDAFGLTCKVFLQVRSVELSLARDALCQPSLLTHPCRQLSYERRYEVLTPKMDEDLSALPRILSNQAMLSNARSVLSSFIALQASRV